jgi:phosphoribosyl 1,2-cyclic phosphodiesterase
MTSGRLRVAVLASGSKGNAALIEYGNTRVLLDCGLPLAELEKRLAAIDRGPAELDAILVTHEHGDHCAGVPAVSRKYRVPVWLTGGTGRALADREFSEVVYFSCHCPFDIGELHIEPMPVPHDAREPSQFVFHSGSRRIGWLTDLGHVSPHVLRMLHGCHGLMIEFNHDAGMLERGPYPAFLRRRVGGPFGHLNNDQAIALIEGIDRSNLDSVAALHLSEVNNAPELVRRKIAAALNGSETRIEVASQGDTLPWLEF